MEDVHSAWRREMSLYHPDKVASLGPEFAVIAEKRIREINAAYDKAQRLRA